MEQSSNFYNFISVEGTPNAVLIKSKGVTGPRKVALFYPDSRYYLASRNYIRENTYEWNVNGPFATDWRLQKTLPVSKKSSILNVHGKNVRFRGDRYETSNQRRRIVYPIVPPEPRIIIEKVEVPVRVTQETIIEERKKKSNDPLDEFLPDRSSPINTDLQALLESKGFARRENNGDILHMVKSNKEKFIAIVNWYTQSTDNTPQIQIANPHIEDIHNLSVNTVVRIPYKLIKEFKRMPEEAIYMK